jgi:hypothetical protein
MISVTGKQRQPDNDRAQDRDCPLSVAMYKCILHT